MAPYLLIGLTCGLASIALVLSTAAGSVVSILLLYLAPFPLFVAGLGWRFASALVGALVATGLALAVGGPGFALAYALACAVAPALLARYALLSRPAGNGGTEWYPVGSLLAFLPAIASVGVVLAAIATAGVDGGLYGYVHETLAPAAVSSGPLGAELDSGRLPLSRADLQQAIAALLAPAVASTWMLVMVLNGSLAQALLAQSGHAVRPRPNYAEAAAPYWLAGLLAAGIVLTFFSGTLGLIGATVTTATLTAYFLLGLAVVHAMSRALPARVLALAALYLMIGLFFWLAILVAVLGVIDQWTGLRQRALGSGGRNREDD